MRNSRIHSSWERARGSPRPTRAERTLRSWASAPSPSASPRSAERCLATVAGERPGALELVAVGAHRLGREVVGGGRAEEGGEGAVDGGVGAARLARALARRELGRPRGQRAGVDDVADRRGGPLQLR
jgi:hypothetical protein